MQFDFFTLGGRIFWEDVFNYQNWVIQRNVKNKKYRLLDSHNIRRASGTFTICKETLLKYIEAYEIEEPYNDTIILLHSFGRTKHSLTPIIKKFSNYKANIIAINYASLKKDMNNQSNLLIQFFKNMNLKGNTYFINFGTGCLLLRKFLDNSNNYRKYNITRVLDINPINSGSDLAELLVRKSFFRKLLGPMLLDISTKKAITLGLIPKEIQHGIIFCPSKFNIFIKKLFSRFDSFPSQSIPSEHQYSEEILTLDATTYLPLQNKKLQHACYQYITTGKFPEYRRKNTN